MVTTFWTSEIGELSSLKPTDESWDFRLPVFSGRWKSGFMDVTSAQEVGWSEHLDVFPNLFVGTNWTCSFPAAGKRLDAQTQSFDRFQLLPSKNCVSVKASHDFGGLKMCVANLAFTCYPMTCGVPPAAETGNHWSAAPFFHRLFSQNDFQTLRHILYWIWFPHLYQKTGTLFT